jgi:hypothetical protein
MGACYLCVLEPRGVSRLSDPLRFRYEALSNGGGLMVERLCACGSRDVFHL